MKNKKEWIRILLSVLFISTTFIVPLSEELRFVFYFIAYLIVGINVLLQSLKNIIHGKFLDENFLMSLATVGAFCIGEYLEAVLVMLLYQIGESFQKYATYKSRVSISSLMDIRPDYANVKIGDHINKLNPNDVNINDIIVVSPGEKVPLDGTIINGESNLDMKALSGESIPKSVKKGDEVLSGSVNLNGLLTIKVTKKYTESTVSKILDLVENASSRKSTSENFITKFAKIYTPVVVFLSILLAFLPPLIIPGFTFQEALQRALTFLVISCPCALVISVPLSFFGGIGGASKKGILIKGSNYLETLSKIDTVIFDKTGTLTKGAFEVVKVDSSNVQEMLEYASHAESFSSHPIALSILRAYNGKIKKERIKEVLEQPGFGIKAKIDQKDVLVGNNKLMVQENIEFKETKEIGTIIHVAINKKYQGYFVIADEIKETTKEALQLLKNKEIVMLTGDNEVISKKIAQELDIKEYYANLLPLDKVNVLEKIKSDKKFVAFVGDGMNDAPVLMRSDIGISMGGVGSESAIEAADVVIMDDDLRKISEGINISKRTLKIVKQNIIFAIGIKILFLILGAFGISNMMSSVFADVGVSILAIFNAMRTLK